MTSNSKGQTSQAGHQEGALRFFCYRDDSAREWRLKGSREELGAFAQMVRSYTADPRHAAPPARMRLGPHSSLEIGTWHEPAITDRGIAGPTIELVRLAADIEGRLATTTPGNELRFRASFAPGAPYELVLEVMGSASDPARGDLSGE